MKEITNSVVPYMSADGAATAVPVAGDRAASPLPSSHSSASSFVGADVSDTYAEAMNVASVLVSVSKLKGKQDEVAYDSKDDTDEDTKKDKTSVKEKRESSETKSEEAEESRVDATAAATQDKLLRSLKSFLSRAGFICASIVWQLVSTWPNIAKLAKLRWLKKSLMERKYHPMEVISSCRWSGGR